MKQADEKKNECTVRTTVLRVALLGVAYTHNELLNGNRLLVAVRVPLRLDAQRLNQNVGVSRDAGDGDAEGLPSNV